MIKKWVFLNILIVSLAVPWNAQGMEWAKNKAKNSAARLANAASAAAAQVTNVASATRTAVSQRFANRGGERDEDLTKSDNMGEGPADAHAAANETRSNGPENGELLAQQDNPQSSDPNVEKNWREKFKDGVDIAKQKLSEKTTELGERVSNSPAVQKARQRLGFSTNKGVVEGEQDDSLVEVVVEGNSATTSSENSNTGGNGETNSNANANAGSSSGTMKKDTRHTDKEVADNLGGVDFDRTFGGQEQGAGAVTALESLFATCDSVAGKLPQGKIKKELLGKKTSIQNLKSSKGKDAEKKINQEAAALIEQMESCSLSPEDQKALDELKKMVNQQSSNPDTTYQNPNNNNQVPHKSMVSGKLLIGLTVVLGAGLICFVRFGDTIKNWYSAMSMRFRSNYFLNREYAKQQYAKWFKIRSKKSTV